MSHRPSLSVVVSNVDVIIGVALAVVVAVLSAFGIVSFEVVSAVALALLALLLTLFLRLRPMIGALNATVEQQRTALSSVHEVLTHGAAISSAIEFDYPNLNHEIAYAQRILIVAGGSLRTTVGSFYYQFTSAVGAGAEIRLLCPNPNDCKAMTLLAAAQRSSAKDMADNIRANLRIAAKLRDSAARGGSVELRILPNLPNLGLVYIVDHVSTRETLYVKLLPYGQTSGAAPVMRLDGARDGALFHLLLNTAETIWDDGTPAE